MMTSVAALAGWRRSSTTLQVHKGDEWPQWKSKHGSGFGRVDPLAAGFARA
jgi:hypothetical protein